jgi:hypothetical protein
LLTCYAIAKKPYTVALAEAFKQGAGGGRVTTELRPRLEGPALVVGMKAEQRQLIAAYARAGLPWFEGDYGYLRRASYFRITRGAFWVDGRTEKPDYERLERLKITFNEARTRGGPIVICCQSDGFYPLSAGMTSQAWRAQVVTQIRAVTKRPVMIRQKPLGKLRYMPPLARQLNRAWALVTLSSSAAFEALALGVPVVVTDESYLAARLGGQLEDIERPRLPSVAERREIFAIAAANQWTLAELAAGQAARALRWD